MSACDCCADDTLDEYDRTTLDYLRCVGVRSSLLHRVHRTLLDAAAVTS